MKHFSKTFLAILLCSARISFSQNYIDKYLTDALVYTTIAGSAQGINEPRDLDFKPNSMELWVANYGDGNGGTNVIIYNAGLANQTSQFRKDSHSGHFMMFPTAIAFSDIGEWGSTAEVKNTADPSSTFMGPALWSGDTTIFARVFQNNWQTGFPLGSHIDMLHQSPFAMGIAHEANKIYWVSDGWNGNLCKYDFVADHSPGYDDHSAGRIWRYTDIGLTREVGIPGHMIMDKTTKWLYIINAGAKQLIRVNTNTGTVGGNLPVPNSGGEILSLYKSVTGATKELLDTYASQPCGIDYFNDRLIVGDYTTGDIRIYNTAPATPTLMGTIVTGQPGIMGLKIGYDGKIWFVNKTSSKVVRIDPLKTTNDVSVIGIITPSTINYEKDYHSAYYNDCSSSIIAPKVRIQNEGSNPIISATISYMIDGGSPVTYTWTGFLATDATATVTLPPSIITDGNHKLEVYSSNPNGNADNNPLNDKKEGGFRSKDGTVPAPFMEDFSQAQFPPAGWSYMGYNKYCHMSYIANYGGHGSNTGCLKMDNTSGGVDITGQTDYILSPRIDLNPMGVADLEFDVAYAQYTSSTDDKLDVKISIDCGETWTNIYDKAGATLSTTSPMVATFYPEAWEWRAELVSLDAFVGHEILLLFTTTSNYGNNLYLDNIKISGLPVGIRKEDRASFITVFPNPGSGVFTLRSSAKNISDAQVFTLLGVNVTDNLKIQYENNKVVIDLSDQPSGTYFIKSLIDGVYVTKKIIIQGN